MTRTEEAALQELERTGRQSGAWAHRAGWRSRGCGDRATVGYYRTVAQITFTFGRKSVGFPLKLNPQIERISNAKSEITICHRPHLLSRSICRQPQIARRKRSRAHRCAAPLVLGWRRIAFAACGSGNIEAEGLQIYGDWAVSHPHRSN